MKSLRESMGAALASLAMIGTAGAQPVSLFPATMRRTGAVDQRFQLPAWIKAAVTNWITASGVSMGPIFRPINKAQRVGNSGFSPKVIWGVVKAGCSKCGLENVAPHDLRRTCARPCHEAGGELEQIQFLLDHVSVQTTERYELRATLADWSGLILTNLRVGRQFRHNKALAYPAERIPWTTQGEPFLYVDRNIQTDSGGA
jgi:integrase